MTSKNSRHVSLREKPIVRANECTQNTIAINVFAPKTSIAKHRLRRTRTVLKSIAESLWPRRWDCPKAVSLFTSEPTIAAQLDGAVQGKNTWQSRARSRRVTWSKNADLEICSWKLGNLWIWGEIATTARARYLRWCTAFKHVETQSFP